MLLSGLGYVPGGTIRGDVRVRRPFLGGGAVFVAPRPTGVIVSGGLPGVDTGPRPGSAPTVIGGSVVPQYGPSGGAGGGPTFQAGAVPGYDDAVLPLTPPALGPRAAAAAGGLPAWALPVGLGAGALVLFLALRKPRTARNPRRSRRRRRRR